MTDRELLEQALTAIEWATDMIPPKTDTGCDCLLCVAQDAIRARLREPEVCSADQTQIKPEPVAYGVRPVVPQQGREFSWAEIEEYEGMAEAAAQDLEAKYDRKFVVVPLYTTPPTRQPLTSEQMALILDSFSVHYGLIKVFEFARAVEQAHGIGVDA